VLHYVRVKKRDTLYKSFEHCEDCNSDAKSTLDAAVSEVYCKDYIIDKLEFIKEEFSQFIDIVNENLKQDNEATRYYNLYVL
jgi:hypothetical protein